MTAPEFGVRRLSREMALQLLFQCEFRSGPAGAAKSPKTAAPHVPNLEVHQAQDMLRRFSSEFQVEPEVSQYGGVLFLGVIEHLTAIDAMIQSHSAHWKVSRMALVDLAIMRISTLEMKLLAQPVNPKISIDEAVEIAKKYGSTESSAFVNGILDQIARATKV